MAGLVAAALAAPGTAALACGMTVSADGATDLQGMSALLSFDGTHEDLAVVVSYAAPTGAFAWLMPLPATPQISPTSIQGLSNGFRITTPPLESAYTLQPNAPYGVAGSPGGGQRARAHQDRQRRVRHSRRDRRRRGGDLDDSSRFPAYHDTQPRRSRATSPGWSRLTQRRRSRRHTARSRSASPSPHPSRSSRSPSRGPLTRGRFRCTSWSQLPTGRCPPPTPRPRVPASNGTEPAPQSRLELRYTSTLSGAERLQLANTMAVPAGYWLTRYDATWQVSDLTRDLVLNRADDQSKVNFDKLYTRFQAERDRKDRTDRAGSSRSSARS